MKLASDLVTIDGVTYLDTYLLNRDGDGVQLARSLDNPAIRNEIVAEHLKVFAREIKSGRIPYDLKQHDPVVTQ